MAKILLFNAPSRRQTYIETNVRVAAPSYPNLTLATLAGQVSPKNEVAVIDLDFAADPQRELCKKVKEFHPDIVGTSVKTPDYPVIISLLRSVKKIMPETVTITGGVHVTALPQESFADGCIDIIVLGEGDFVIEDLLSGMSRNTIPGIMYKTGEGHLHTTPERLPIHHLDDLPFPAWNLFAINRYQNSRLSSRKNPVGHIETSRGCSYNCSFCSKLIFGKQFRTKSPARVVAEMEFMLSCGFKEIHICDDSFTQDIDRAKTICTEIIRRKKKFPWSLINGVRVDKVDKEFFRLARRAGCWQVGFGLETGDQSVLDAIHKNTTLEDAEKAIRAAHQAGVETFGFFIFGLPGETELSLKRTIAFAKKLSLTIAKVDICVPYPGTVLFSDLLSQGRIKSREWSRYLCHQTALPLFEHANLSWPTIERYYKKWFREFYLRPSYIWNRFWRDVRKGDVFYDITYLFKSRW